MSKLDLSYTKNTLFTCLNNGRWAESFKDFIKALPLSYIGFRGKDGKYYIIFEAFKNACEDTGLTLNQNELIGFLRGIGARKIKYYEKVGEKRIKKNAYSLPKTFKPYHKQDNINCNNLTEKGNRATPILLSNTKDDKKDKKDKNEYDFGIDEIDILDIPEPLYEKERAPYELTGYRRIGVINDIHLPFHDVRALRVALKTLKKYEIDTLIMNGDIVDFYSVSFWEKDPSYRNLQAERDNVLKAFDVIRNSFKDVEIIYKEGNHEERLQRYLYRNAPELSQLEELQVYSFLKLNDFGIEYVGDKKRIQAGNLDIIHGHEYRSFASINIAMTFLRRASRNILIGHYHKKQEEVKKTIRDELYGAWVVGCLCNLKPSYMVNNEWTHGFAFIELFENGHFSVKNHTIQDEEVF